MNHRTTSQLLDCCIYLLEEPTPWLVKLIIRWYKRQLEKNIPVYRGHV